MKPEVVTVTDGKLTVSVPELVHENGRSQHIGDDVAFKIVRKSAE